MLMPNANKQVHIDAIYKEMNQSSRGGMLWDSLTFEERSFFCKVAKVGKKTDIIETAKKKLCELNDFDRIKILKKIQGLQRLVAPFANLSRYEFK